MSSNSNTRGEVRRGVFCNNLDGPGLPRHKNVCTRAFDEKPVFAGKKLHGESVNFSGWRGAKAISRSHLDRLLKQPSGFVEPDLALGLPQQASKLLHVLRVRKSGKPGVALAYEQNPSAGGRTRVATDASPHIKIAKEASRPWAGVHRRKATSAKFVKAERVRLSTETKMRRSTSFPVVTRESLDAYSLWLRRLYTTIPQ